MRYWKQISENYIITFDMLLVYVVLVSATLLHCSRAARPDRPLYLFLNSVSYTFHLEWVIQWSVDFACGLFLA